MWVKRRERERAGREVDESEGRERVRERERFCVILYQSLGHKLACMHGPRVRATESVIGCFDSWSLRLTNGKNAYRFAQSSPGRYNCVDLIIMPVSH